MPEDRFVVLSSSVISQVGDGLVYSLECLCVLDELCSMDDHGKRVAYFEDLEEVPNLAVASMNARDDTFKIWKALRHLTEPELILLVMHEFLDGVETKKNMRRCAWSLSYELTDR